MTVPEGGSAETVRCPICGASVQLGVDERCHGCGSRTADPLYRQVIDADQQLSAYHTQYDEIMGKWNALATQHRVWMTRLLATRAPTKPRHHVGPVAWGGTGEQTWRESAAAATPKQSVSRPARKRKPSLEHRPKRRLTAPILLGIAGASMLITAAIVFIAVTWETIFPLAQGLLVLAVAGAIAWLSLWLSYHDLLVSGGAVGVVAMAFTGVAVVAFNRAEGDLGDFAISIALLASSASGYALSRRKVRWVGPMAALSLIGTPVSLAIAFMRLPGSGRPALSTLVGVAAGVAVGLTLRWWTAQPERWIVSVGYTAVVTLSVIPAGLELAGAESLDPFLLCAALLPIPVLVIAGKWMPNVTIGPAMLVATAVALAAVSGPTDHGSSSVAAGTAVAAVAIALITLAPKTWRLPALIGAVPMAIGALVLLVVQVGRLVAWAVAFRLDGRPPTIDEWTAVAALALAATIAATRLWRDRPPWVGRLEVSGAILATAGFAGLAFPVTRMLPSTHLWWLALVLEVGGAATAIAAFAWKNTLARKVSGIGGVAVATLGALNAVWPLAMRTVPLAVGLALGLGPALVLTAGIRRWPRITLAPAALLIPIIAAAAVTDGDHWARASANGAAIVAAILWAALRMPATWRGPIAVGLAVPLGGALLASLWWTVPVLVRTLVEGASGAGNFDAWGGLTAAFAGAALAALTRWRVPTVVATVFGVMGALVTLTAAIAADYTAASEWGDGRAVAIAWTGSVAALIAAAFAMLWVPVVAKWTSGAGAALLITISGFNGIVAFASPRTFLPTGLAALLLPIALLVAFSRWCPNITLGPASFLATAGVAAIAHRCGLPGEAQVAFGVAAAALILWAVRPWPNRLRLPLASGLVPAIVTAVGFSLYALPLGLLSIPEPGPGSAWASGIEWVTATMVGAAIAAAACRNGWGMGLGARVANGLGALFSVAAASAGTAWFALSTHQSPGLNALVGTGVAILVALTALVWTTTPARKTVGIFGAAWATFCALPTLLEVGRGDYPISPGLGAVTLTIAVLVAASIRWPMVTLGPVSLLTSLAAIAWVSAMADTWEKTVIAAAAVIAIYTWIAKWLGPRLASPLILGLVPAGILVTWALLAGFGRAYIRLMEELFSRGEAPISGLLAIVAALTAIALLAWRPAYINAGWAMLPFALIVSASLPHPWASISVLALGMAGVVAAPRIPDAGWNVRPGATVVCLALGVGWAAGDESGLAAAATVAAVAAGWLAIRTDRSFRNSALVGTHVFAALAAGAGVSAMGGHAPVAFGAAMAVAMGVSLGIRARRLDPTMDVTFVTIGAATLFIPAWAPSLTAGGVATLIAGAGWLGHAVFGSRNSRWISSLVLSIGAAEVLAGAQINVIEAYTAVPAGTVLAIGLWWLAEDAEVRTFRALGPGLGLALIPSYIALALQPDSLTRTLALTAATIVLALTGVLLRWFAPIVATAVTAVTVSLTQVAVGSDIVPRWVSFGIVGAILLTIAATYEKLQKLR